MARCNYCSIWPDIMTPPQKRVCLVTKKSKKQLRVGRVSLRMPAMPAKTDKNVTSLPSLTRPPLPGCKKTGWWKPAATTTTATTTTTTTTTTKTTTTARRTRRRTKQLSSACFHVNWGLRFLVGSFVCSKWKSNKELAPSSILRPTKILQHDFLYKCSNWKVDGTIPTHWCIRSLY